MKYRTYFLCLFIITLQSSHRLKGIRKHLQQHKLSEHKNNQEQDASAQQENDSEDDEAVNLDHLPKAKKEFLLQSLNSFIRDIGMKNDPYAQQALENFFKRKKISEKILTNLQNNLISKSNWKHWHHESSKHLEEIFYYSGHTEYKTLFHEAGHTAMHYFVTHRIPFSVALYMKNKEGLAGRLFLDNNIQNYINKYILYSEHELRFFDINILIADIMISMAGLASEYIFWKNEKVSTWKNACMYYQKQMPFTIGDTDYCERVFSKYSKFIEKKYDFLKTISIKQDDAFLYSIKNSTIRSFFQSIYNRTYDNSTKEQNMHFYLEPLYQLTIKILNEHKALIYEIAYQLSEKGTLYENDLKEIFYNENKIIKKWPSYKLNYDGMSLIPQKNHWPSNEFLEKLVKEKQPYNKAMFSHYDSPELQSWRGSIQFIDDPIFHEYVNIPMPAINQNIRQKDDTDGPVLSAKKNIIPLLQKQELSQKISTPDVFKPVIRKDNASSSGALNRLTGISKHLKTNEFSGSRSLKKNNSQSILSRIWQWLYQKYSSL